MGYGGEIGTAYVRIRPLMAGLAGEMNAGVKAALAGVNGDVKAYARQLVADSTEEVRANERVMASLREIGTTAAAGSREAMVAMRLYRDFADTNAAHLGELFAREGAEACAAAKKMGAAESAGIIGGITSGTVKGEELLTAAYTKMEAQTAEAARQISALNEQGIAGGIDAGAVAGAGILSSAVAEMEVATAGGARRISALNEAGIAGGIRRGVADGEAVLDASLVRMKAVVAASAGKISATEAAGIAGGIRRGAVEGQAKLAGALGKMETESAGTGRKIGATVGDGIAAGIGRGAEKGEGFIGRMKSRFLNMGSVLGIGFGTAFAVHFVKDLTSGAARTQNSMLSVRQEFGKATPIITQFVNTTAAGLHITDQAAYTTAQNFGILFKNLGITGGAAATMTVGWQKLVGAISEIRGVDPSAIMSRVPMAAAGNVRALKQLGLAINSASKNQQTFADGFGKSFAKLGPAQASIVIYQLAMQHLGTFTQQAAAHAHNYANEQLALSTAWSNAKDVIGGALLPTFTEYTGKLADWLTKMTKSGKLQRDMNSALKDAKGFFDAIKSVLGVIIPPIETLIHKLGGARDAALLLFGAFAASKIAGIANTIVEFLVKKGILAIGAAAVTAQTDSTVAFAGIGISAQALGVTIKTALVTTGIGAAIVAVGLLTAYVMTHWDKVKEWTIALGAGLVAVWHGLGSNIMGTMKIVAGVIASELTWPLMVFLKAAGKVTGWLSFLPGVGGLHNKINDAQKALASITTGLIVSGARQDNLMQDFAKAWDKSIDKHLGKNSPTEKKLKKAVAAMLSDAALGAGYGGGGGLPKPVDPSKAAQQAADAANAVFSNAVKQAIANAAQAYKNALRAAGQQVASAEQSYADFVRLGQQRINNAIANAKATYQNAMAAAQSAWLGQAQAAESNLSTIGNKLLGTLNQFFTATKNVVNPLTQGALGAQMKGLFTQLAAGGSTPAALVQSALQVSSQMNVKGLASPVAQAKAHAKAVVTTIVEEFLTGKISAKTAMTELWAMLSREDVNAKRVGHTLGTGVKDAFLAQIQAMFIQMEQIQGLKGTSAGRKLLKDLQATLIGPVGGVRIDYLIGPRARHSQATDAAQDRLASSTKKINTELSNYEIAKREHHHREMVQIGNAMHREQMALQKQLATDTREHLRVAARNASIALKAVKAAEKTAGSTSLAVNTWAFGGPQRSSVNQNMGHAGQAARNASKGGVQV